MNFEWYKKNTTKKLYELVEKGLASIETHPNHHLELGVRESIYLELGPFVFEEGQKNKSGHKRRVELAKLVLEKIAPLWRKAWPSSDLAEVYLSKFYRVLNTESYQEKKELVSDWLDDADNIADWANNTWMRDKEHKIHRLSNSMAGIAIVRGILIAGSDSFLCNELDQVSIENKDEDIEDILGRELHYYAAFAYSGGLPCDEARDNGYDIGDKEKLREFWNWWLLEALPAAWIKE